MKIRIVATVVMEYDLDESNYDEEASTPECLEQDLNYARNVPLEFFDAGLAVWSITGEVL